MRPEIVYVFLDVGLRIALVNHRHSCDGAEKVVLPLAGHQNVALALPSLDLLHQRFAAIW